jgi:preprotein translocase subunit SecD
MNRSLVVRATIIVSIVGLMAFSAYPPEEAIKLGLDLQGGIHLVLRVETEDAIKAETDKDIDRLLQEIEDMDVPGATAERTGNSSFTVSGVPVDKDDAIKDDVVDTYLPGWKWSREGDKLVFDMDLVNKNEIRDLAVRQAEETIRNRIDAFGVAEPIVHREGIGANRIVVQLPGVDDPERVKRIIKNTAFLEFRLVKEGTGAVDSREQLVAALGGSVPPDVEIVPQEIRNDEKQVVGQRFWALEARRVITGRDLKTARPSQGQFNEANVSFILTREGGRKFADVTGASKGRNLAIVLDNKVMSAPTIEDRISDQGIIRGDFTFQEVQDLVTVLRSGALPAGLTYLEERSVGPTLGRDSIDQGIKAGMIGGALVVVTMLVVYMFAGINAILALTLNVVIVFGALAMFDATLTLPGIAGIVLTIGMAVDANVLVFERIREEDRAGRTPKSSIDAGFGKALSSIIDANITTLIAAMFLFLFGTGPIRGFAVTLSVGILASLFTAVFCSRWMFDFFYGRRQRVDSISIG